MSKPGPERLLELLDVQLEAFAMCEIDRHCGLSCKPADTILVHFVLDGEGAIDCVHGRFDLRPGRVVLVPRGLAKTIEGPAPVLSLTDADQSCALAPGLVSFRACASGVPGLVLGCGSVSVGMGGTPGLLDHLDRPLIEECAGGPLPMMFAAMTSELRRPGAGTKAMVEALMKQILVVVLRSHLARRAGDSPLHLMLQNPQLGRAVAAIVTHPEMPHSVESLAGLAGMSRSSFNRQFSASYGCSPMEFVQTVRLRAAARMLAGSSLPVKSIAAAVGYASRSHFSRAFAAEFGMDPSRFRDSGEMPPEPGASVPAAAAEPDTQADRAEEADAAELRNRLRNTLARVRSVARRTGRSSASVEEYSAELEARINAMARAEARSPDGPSSGTPLQALLADALGLQCADVLAPVPGGPAVALDAKSGEVMALALGDLAANSRRHGGALSRGAAPAVAWTVGEREGRPWLVLRWEEAGGGSVPAVRRGFGTELITRRIAYELGGTGTMDFTEAGFLAEIALPLAPPAPAAPRAQVVPAAATA
jgi:AraC-like DNA-binding protein